MHRDLGVNMETHKTHMAMGQKSRVLKKKNGLVILKNRTRPPPVVPPLGFSFRPTSHWFFRVLRVLELNRLLAPKDDASRSSDVKESKAESWEVVMQSFL